VALEEASVRGRAEEVSAWEERSQTLTELEFGGRLTNEGALVQDRAITLHLDVLEGDSVEEGSWRSPGARKGANCHSNRASSRRRRSREPAGQLACGVGGEEARGLRGQLRRLGGPEVKL
jgi:hypothetical protein